jgi:hypothetical protein
MITVKINLHRLAPGVFSGSAHTSILQSSDEKSHRLCRRAAKIGDFSDALGKIDMDAKTLQRRMPIS